METDYRKARNNLCYTGFIAAVISMLFSNFSRLFSFVSALVAVIAFFCAVSLMFFIFVKDRQKSKSS